MNKASNAVLKDGAIQLTWLPGHTTALLTVRGKDHDMTPAEMRVLAQALTEAAMAGAYWASQRKGPP